MLGTSYQSRRILQTVNMKEFLVICLVIATAALGVSAGPIWEGNIDGRIINGSSATDQQALYQVVINTYSETQNWWCGGSIINKTWLMTSADCIHGATNITVYYGSNKLEDWNIRTIITPTYANVIVHPHFNPDTLVNNIGLIRTAVFFYNEATKVELPAADAPSDFNYAGMRAEFTGWGATKEGNETHSDSLRNATYEVLPMESCRSAYGANVANEDVICVATPNNTGPCVGDSGSPLILHDAGRRVQIGIMSFWRFQDCAQSPIAGLTRVSSHLDWIQVTTSKWR